MNYFGSTAGHVASSERPLRDLESDIYKPSKYENWLMMITVKRMY